MKKRFRQITLSTVVGLCLPVFNAAHAEDKATSAIPDRREFPVNEAVNPCDNFYEYACSKVNASFKLRDDRSSHTFSFSDSHERLLEKKKTYLKEIAEKKSGKQSLSPRSDSLATVYSACMNPDAHKTEELARVQGLKDELAAIKTNADFQKFLIRQNEIGRPSFIGGDSLVNLDNPEKLDFSIFANMTTLPERSYYLKKDVVKDYRSVLELFFATIGESKAVAKKNADVVIKHETAFAKIDPLPAEARELYTKRTSITKDKLLKTYPDLYLEPFLAKVPDDTLIRHMIPKSYAFLDKQLKSAKLDELKAVYLFQALNNLMDDAYPDFYKASFEFEKKHLGGPDSRPSRDERCTMMVMGRYEKEIDAEVLPLVFPNFPEEKFVALAESVRKSIIDGVKTNDWLSDDGKKGAIEKIQKATLQLVKPKTEEDWYFNPEVQYAADKPIGNAEKLSAAIHARSFAELKEKRNRMRWYMGPLTINAYYSAEDNQFVMPVGILQYPFYDPNLSEITNLGAVGAVIGHELGHGIDDQGAQMDADGKLRQWMSDKDVKNFQTRGKKFISQFDKAGHNGKLTLGENIGDLTGVTFAYRAAFPEGKGTVQQKKDFFTQYARVWCGVQRPKFTEQRLKTDPHSLGWARVNEQVKNQPAFAEAFSCKKGDKMVLDPKDIVKIW
ncbi:MAG: M13 family peptidase [Proteobacteria bacterium]|nr:MAG: M13 family peptidase [Pseudomonadota bacterium]